VRTLLFAAATLTTPSQIMKLYPRTAHVSVSMSSFTALRPDRAYDHLVAEAAERYDLDPALVKAVMRTESSFDPFVVSPAGAQGLMQLMPSLAEEMGVTDVFDPRQNIMGGAKYLRQLLDAIRGSGPLALASYNAGPGNLARYKGIPPFEETRSYVKKVTALLAGSEERRLSAD
jgi:soluble lytic murein transglycosylase-like protein